VAAGRRGRSILGPYATQEEVQILNHKLGADRPLPVRYAHWLEGFVTSHWGTSPVLNVPGLPAVMKALGNSRLLAALALVIIVPTAIALGVYAGLRRDSLIDHGIPGPRYLLR